MEFGKLKNTVDWEISERIIDFVKVYAEYAKCSESKVVEKFLGYILDDENFMNYRANEILKQFNHIIDNDDTLIKWEKGELKLKD